MAEVDLYSFPKYVVLRSYSSNDIQNDWQNHNPDKTGLVFDHTFIIHLMISVLFMIACYVDEIFLWKKTLTREGIFFG